jgi:hypothetical protein
MYNINIHIAMFKPESVESAIAAFNKTALDERMRYKPIYQAIEDYIALYTTPNKVQKKETLIIMGGTQSVDLLLGKELGRDDFIYNLFSEDAFQHCNRLTNVIAQTINAIFTDNKDPLSRPYWTVAMKTFSAHKKFDIVIDQRTLVRWIVLKTMSDESNIMKLIEPLNVKSYFQKKTVLIMPPKFHLIETYRTLYSPDAVESWNQALIDERRLFGYLKRIMDLQKAGKSIVVGADDQIDLNKRKMIAATLLEEFVKNNSKVILLGDHAINILTEIPVDTTILHIMIDHDISLDDIKPTIIDICKRTIDIAPTYSTRDVQILSDFRLRRTSVKIDGKEIIYIYNATSYDLIPICRVYDKKKNSIQIGNPFVLIRFMLIELWVISWISSIGKIEDSFAKSRTNSMISKILKLRSSLAKKSDDSKKFKTSIDDKFIELGPMQIFQSRDMDYLGQFESEQKAQKTKAQSEQKFFDYYPQEFYNKNNKYRSF